MKRVLIIENFSADFYKARIPLAKHLMKSGWKVSALVPSGEYVQRIRDHGIEVLEYDLDRKNKGLKQLFSLLKIYRKIIKDNQIDIIHSFRFQPNLLNVLANLFNRKRVILHITGLGIAFANNSFPYLLLRLMSQLIFQLKLLRADKVIVQNEDDAKDIWFGRSWKNKINVILGSGVNTGIFDSNSFNKISLRQQMSISRTDIVFICVTRLIWEKGIDELMESFKIIHSSHKNAKLLIVGWSDHDNPRHVPKSYIDKWNGKHNITFLGRKENIRELLVASDVFIYPSYYREGIPRGILEALSMGLPVITTTTPGCKLTVVHGENGYLIKPGSIPELTNAMEKILQSDMTEMSLKSRTLAEEQFSDVLIFSQIENTYYK
jgi:glycosyltransferase involved in cell wall biosynthesis